MKIKAKILTVLGVVVLAVSPMCAKFYLGVEGGYNRSNFTFLSQSTGSRQFYDKSNLVQNGFAGNVVLGTEHFFGKYFGLRWGLGAGGSVSVGSMAGESLQLDTTYFGSSFDLFGNFIAKEGLSIGLVAGIEYAVMWLEPEKETILGASFTRGTNGDQKIVNVYVNNRMFSKNFIGRIGLSTLIGGHHRVEMMVKVPFNTASKGTRYDEDVIVNNNHTTNIHAKFNIDYEFIQAMFSYRYVF